MIPDSECHQPKTSISNDEINIQELLVTFWKGKWTIISSSLMAAVIAVIYTLSLPNIYKSEALLSPTEDNSRGSLNALAGQFGGLASLAGVNLGGSSGSKVTIALEILKSRQFIGEFIEVNGLKPVIYAAEEWNKTTNSIVYDSNLFIDKSNEWVHEKNTNKTSEPSLLEVYKKFQKENLSVTQDKETGLVKLSVKHISPFVAQKIASMLVESINSKMRQNDIGDAQKSIDYLSKALGDTNVADMQQVFYQLIEKQQQTKMLANVRDEYVLKVIDPPIVAEEKSEPNRAIICILLTFIGSIFGISTVVLRKFLRN